MESAKASVAVMIIKDGKVLLGKRKNSHGEGEFAFPGGHLEYMEGIFECAKRETKEECGIEIKNLKFQFVGNVMKYNPKHYVHISIIADWSQGEPQVLEPEKCESWDWYSLDKLPTPLFEFSKMSIDNYGKDIVFFDKIV